MKPNKLFLTLAVASTLFLSACEKEGSMNGAFDVAMTDAPADYANLNVEITGVSVWSSSSGWVSIDNKTRMVNVLSLTNGNETKLASSTDLKAGTYSKVMITFGDHHSIGIHGDISLGGIYADGIATFGLDFPGDKSVVVEINEEVKGSNSSKVLLDFDAASSVTYAAGKYILKPVIRDLRDAKTGIRGKVEGTASAMIHLEGEGFNLTTYTSATGEFLIRGLKKGVYNCSVIPAADADPVTSTPEPIVVGNTVVTDGEITYVGIIQF